jgi:2-haloacid dehalogenase
VTTVAFDVNETLLDLRALRDPFVAAFGDASPMGEWFARLLHASVVANQVGAYHPFGELAGVALDGVAHRRGVVLSAAERTAIVGGLLHLPPHSDVVPGLERLRAAGSRVVALTNGSPEAVAAQLSNGGIRHLFDEALSVEPSGKFKPDPAPYGMAAAHLGVDPGKLWMVAAHDWDIAGAKHAGWRGAYVARGGLPYSPLLPAADVAAPDLGGVVDAILASA